MLTIRSAKSEDAQAIAEIGKASFAQAHPNAAPEKILKKYLEEKFNAKKIAVEIDDNKNIFHLLLYNFRPIGFSKIQLNSILPIAGKEKTTELPENNLCKLERLYLLEEHHGSGKGLLFHSFLEEYAAKENQFGIWLTVWVHNKRAIRFYEKNRYEIMGETNFKLSQDYSNPNFVMIKKF